MDKIPKQIFSDHVSKIPISSKSRVAMSPWCKYLMHKNTPQFLISLQHSKHRPKTTHTHARKSRFFNLFYFDFNPPPWIFSMSQRSITPCIPGSFHGKNSCETTGMKCWWQFSSSIQGRMTGLCDKMVNK